jgi:CheY-like chemotaxis protein
VDSGSFVAPVETVEDGAMADSGPDGAAPVAPAALGTAPNPVYDAMALARYPLAGMRALLLDRSGVSRKAIRELLTELGAEQVMEGQSLNDALMTLRLQAVHLIISEFTLEGGATAQTLVEQLRAEKLLPMSTMFVLTSAERSARAVASIAEFTPDAYVIKPLVLDDMRSRLARASHRKRALFVMYAAIEDGDLELALTEARAIAQANRPPRSEALRAMTQALFDAGRYDQVEELTRIALEGERYPWALYRMAQVRFKTDRFGEAEQLLVSLIKYHPDHLAGYELLAQIRQMQGRFNEALECLDQVAGRSNPTLRRLRQTGALARQVGDLERAERSFNEVMQRTQDEGEVCAEDTMNLIQVLNARGKTERAEKLTRQQLERSAGHPDGDVTQAMHDYTSARNAGRRDELEASLTRAVEQIVASVQHVSVPLGLQVLEACLAESMRALGYRTALAMVRSRRADRLTLNRLRDLVQGLSTMPENLLTVEEIPLSLDRLASEGWDHHLGPVIAESLDHWRSRTPRDTRLAGLGERFTTFARRYGILQYG